MRACSFLALALMLLGTIAGCSSWSVHFVPFSPRGPTIDRAVWAYPGDVDAIGAAGGEYVGSLQASSRRVSEGDRIERIVEEAARYGGTHVILVDAATHSMVLGYTTIVTNSGGVAVMRTAPQIRDWHAATYDVFYVPRERWRDLPAPLQPL